MLALPIFFFNDTATTEIYTLSLHDALPICCHEVYNIQVQGLTKRLEATHLQRVVIGISGGLDSTQAALVVARAFNQMKLPRENVVAVTMPGFATSAATLSNARGLMRCLGFSAKEIDIRPSAA